VLAQGVLRYVQLTIGGAVVSQVLCANVPHVSYTYLLASGGGKESYPGGHFVLYITKRCVIRKGGGVANYAGQKLILGNLTYYFGENFEKCGVVCVSSGVWGARGGSFRVWVGGV